MSMTDNDLGQSLFTLFGELKVTLGDLSQSVKQQRKLAESAKRAEQPSYNRIRGSVVLNSNGYGVVRFDLAGPNQGYVWNVRTLVIGGQTPTELVNGRADVFVLASDIRSTTALNGIGIDGWQDSITTLPAVGSYGEGECFLHAMEELWVVLSNGTAGQQINAVANIQNVQEAANKQTTAL